MCSFCFGWTMTE